VPGGCESRKGEGFATWVYAGFPASDGDLVFHSIDGLEIREQHTLPSVKGRR
jgi:hypothetical protein